MEPKGLGMTIEDRLEQLERELAELRKRVRTGQVVIEDDTGKARAILFVDNDGPRLRLYDELGKLRVALGVNKGEPGLVLHDERGEPRAWLYGLDDGAGLTLFDEAGNAIWSAP
jgi:hypothetical protein